MTRETLGLGQALGLGEDEIGRAWVRWKGNWSSQLRFSRTGANEAGSYSEALQKGDACGKGKRFVSIQRVKKGRRERNIPTCFLGDCRLLGASVGRVGRADDRGKAMAGFR